MLHQGRIVKPPTRPSVCNINCWEASRVDSRFGLDRGTTFKRFIECLVLYQVFPCNAMLPYLQKLPLDRPPIRDLTCFDPANKDKSWTVNAIERLCIALLHMVSSSQVSLVKHQWRMYQAGKLSSSWYEKSRENDFW